MRSRTTEAGVVHRHEQTLSGPKKDRRQVLEPRGRISARYSCSIADPAAQIDAILNAAAGIRTRREVIDEYNVVHTLYKIIGSADNRRNCSSS